MRQAAYSTPDRLPPRLGSSARRRGGEAERQRAPITTATASDATIRTAVWTLSSAFAISASGRTSSRLSWCSRNSITANCRTNEAEEEHPDEHAVDGRDEPAAAHEAQDQRGEDDDPHLAEQRASVNASGESI